MSDDIRPAHYGGEDNEYEVIKVLRAWDLELAKGFCWGNVLKYTARADMKDGMADRIKAKWYANELLSIERELAERPQKGPSEIPIIIAGHGNYKLEVDWENRKTKLVKQAGGGGEYQAQGNGGSGSSNAVSAGPGGAGGRGGGGSISPVGGGSFHWSSGVGGAGGACRG